MLYIFWFKFIGEIDESDKTICNLESWHGVMYRHRDEFLLFFISLKCDSMNWIELRITQMKIIGDLVQNGKWNIVHHTSADRMILQFCIVLLKWMMIRFKFYGFYETDRRWEVKKSTLMENWHIRDRIFQLAVMIIMICVRFQTLYHCGVFDIRCWKSFKCKEKKGKNGTSSISFEECSASKWSILGFFNILCTTFIALLYCTTTVSNANYNKANTKHNCRFCYLYLILFVKCVHNVRNW